MEIPSGIFSSLHGSIVLHFLGLSFLRGAVLIPSYSRLSITRWFLAPAVNSFFLPLVFLRKRFLLCEAHDGSARFVVPETASHSAVFGCAF